MEHLLTSCYWAVWNHAAKKKKKERAVTGGLGQSGLTEGGPPPPPPPLPDSLFHDEEHGGVSSKPPFLVKARRKGGRVGLHTLGQVRRLVHEHAVHCDDVGVGRQLPHPRLPTENKQANKQQTKDKQGNVNAQRHCVA